MKIKHKEQILKAAREKQQITYKGTPIRITADLSIETLQVRAEWQHILKVMKEKNLQSRLLYPARISFKYEGNHHSSPRNPESRKQDNPKTEHPRTHINQINKDQTHRTNIKSSKR